MGPNATAPIHASPYILQSVSRIRSLPLARGRAEQRLRSDHAAATPIALARGRAIMLQHSSGDWCRRSARMRCP